MQPLTREEFQEVLPAGVKKHVSQELIDGVNQILTDPNTLDTLRENILGYASVMKEGRFKMVSYLNAVHYVSHKLMGATNIAAFTTTFPGKIARFKKQGVADKDIASYASAYNKSKLVNLIFAQTLVPVHVLNAPMFQQALNTQAELMRDAKSEMVRVTAANSILSILKPPEVNKMELDIAVTDSGVIAALERSTRALVEQQKKKLIEGTMNAKQIAETTILVEDTE